VLWIHYTLCTIEICFLLNEETELLNLTIGSKKPTLKAAQIQV
jgi:hypothetical protein